jgi:hypothetical protein
MEPSKKQLRAEWTVDDAWVDINKIATVDELVKEAAPSFEDGLTQLMGEGSCSREEALDWLSYAIDIEGLKCARFGLLRTLYEMIRIVFAHRNLSLKARR